MTDEGRMAAVVIDVRRDRGLSLAGRGGVEDSLILGRVCGWGLIGEYGGWRWLAGAISSSRDAPSRSSIAKVVKLEGGVVWVRAQASVATGLG